MAETLQEMILRKKKEKEDAASGKPTPSPSPTSDNKAALSNLNTQVSTATRSIEQVANTTGTYTPRETVDIQSDDTKKVDTGEKSIGQKLLEAKKKKAAAAAYIASKTGDSQ